MLRRLAIRGFKSFVDVELELPKLAVLAGPNAAGKSNALDALQMLARAGTQRTLAEALAPPIRGFPAEAFTLPPGGLPELLAQRSARFSFEADLELGQGKGNGSLERLRYRLGVEVDPDTGSLSVADEYLTRATKDWRPKDNPRIDAEDGQLILRRSGGGGRPQHEPLRANHTLLSDARLSGSSYPLFDRLREELRQWRSYYLERIAELLASVSRKGGAQIVVTTHSPGFVAAMLERAESGESDIGLFSVTRDGRSSVVKQLRSLGLWQDQAIDELLEEPDTYDKITALIRRGWLEL